MDSIRIAVEGTVGAGKTTFCNLMKSEYSLDLVSEKFQNPYFDKFYKDSTKYAFPMHIQIFRQQFESLHQSRDFKRVITDRTLEASLIFMKILNRNGQLDTLDFENYRDTVSTFSKLSPSPDLVIYLKVSAETSINRILKRNRPAELDAPIKYWIDLARDYDSWFEEYTSTPKIVIDSDKLDFTDPNFDLRGVVQSHISSQLSSLDLPKIKLEL
ncbi:thymidylate kinase [Listeria phage LIS04]|nr:thymidylate kinase [Listeria phage LIS04]